MEPQLTKMLSGGLNLLAPGDTPSNGEAIAAQNWRTDQAGNLRSRRSHTLLATLGGNVHSIGSVVHISGKNRYYGADDKLYRDGNLIESGFDETPLGLASFQDFAWIMNRNLQVRDDGTNLLSWTPTAPTAAPTSSVEAIAAAPTYGAGAGDGTTGALYGPITYIAVGVIPGVGEVARSAALITTSHNSVPALQWGVVPDSTWKGFSDKAANTVTAPTFADAAITQWNLYRVPMYKDASQEPVVGAYSQVGYLVNAAPINVGTSYTDNGKDNTGTGGDDQRDLAIVKRNIVLGFSVVPGTVTAQVAITGKQVTVYRSQPETVTPQFPFQGNYSYYVTGVTDRNEETNPSPVLTVSLATDGILITRPAFTDASITHWNVYRSGGAFPLQPYLVNADPIALATTTYYDTGKDNTASGGPDQSDTGLVNLGVTLRTDRDPAPAASGVAGPYFQKLLAFNSELHPNRIWWTPSDEPWNFPGSASDEDGNWVDVGDGDPILAIAIFPRRVAILKPSGVYRMVGDPDDWGSDIERTSAETGQIGSKAFAIAGANVFMQSLEGLAFFNGDITQKTSQSLDPIFKGDTVLSTGAVPSAAICQDVGPRGNACMAYRNGRLYFSYPDANAEANNTINGVVTNNATFLFDQGNFYSDSRAFTALYDEGQDGSLLGAFGGNVYILESGTAEADVPLIYQSRYQDQGAPESKKRYADILIDHSTGGRTVTVYAYFDNGATVVNLGTFSSTARTQTVFSLGDEENPAEYRNCSVRLECPAGNAEAQVFAIALHYMTLERNAQTYDSGKIALEKVSMLGAIELDLEILSGTVRYHFWAGLAGGIAELAQGECNTGGGPLVDRTFTAQLPDGAEARWVRLVLAGDNFRCHGARLQVRPYGMFLAGTDDIFRSGDLTFGSPRPKLVQQIRVDCQPDDAVPGRFFTDLPDTMGVRATFQLARSGARSWQRTTLPVNTQGRVQRVEIQAPSPCRVYAIQVRVKVLGEPGGWQWQDVPVPQTPESFSWMPIPIK